MILPMYRAAHGAVDSERQHEEKPMPASRERAAAETDTFLPLISRKCQKAAAAKMLSISL